MKAFLKALGIRGHIPQEESRLPIGFWKAISQEFTSMCGFGLWPIEKITRSRKPATQAIKSMNFTYLWQHLKPSTKDCGSIKAVQLSQAAYDSAKEYDISGKHWQLTDTAHCTKCMALHEQ